MPRSPFADATVVCRAIAGTCDLPETCTGGAPLCPDDAFVPSSSNVTCRPAATACDVAETCAGTAPFGGGLIEIHPAAVWRSTSVADRRSLRADRAQGLRI